MRLKSFKFGNGVSFEKQGVWYKVYTEAEFEMDENDNIIEKIQDAKEFISTEVQKEIDKICED